MTFHLGWPQIIWFCLVLIGIGVNAALHGKTKRVEKYNFFGSVIGAVIVGAFLYWGGFFG